jgi:hypothetical protein
LYTYLPVENEKPFDVLLFCFDLAKKSKSSKVVGEYVVDGGILVLEF